MRVRSRERIVLDFSTMPKTVLVVDDAVDVANMIAAVIEMRGCRALTAYDGREGVKMAITHHPDLVLMDIRMPIMDGYEATKQILADPTLNHTPIVAITAHCEGDWRLKAQEAGCVDCVPKPVDFDILESLMTRLIGDC